MDYKDKYGDVSTPKYFVEEILDLLPYHVWSNPNYKWLDPGCGNGIFIKCVFERLFKNLSTIKDETKRKIHIVQNMLYMVEVNSVYIYELKQYFGENANIYNEDFLLFNNNITYNIIIGNPPYNSNGSIKVPSNTNKNKKNDGKAIWKLFIKKSLQLLNSSGFLNVCIPVIWMKPDKENMYNYFFERNIIKIKCFDNSETNKIFSYKAQTPICIICLQNIKHEKNYQNLLLNHFDNYINYKLNNKSPIPLKYAHIFSIFQPYIEKYGSLQKYIVKTNMPPIKTSLQTIFDEIHSYPNIHSCLIKNKTQPELLIRHSNIPLVYSGVKKIILAHKMYGFPYYDKEGIYGISNRDNYVIIDENYEKTKKLFYFLSTSFVITLFESTRYRMKYLERYIFELLPDISCISDFPEKINNETLSCYFNINLEFTNKYNNYKRFNF